MRSPPLVLLLLMGVQAVLNMGGGRALSTEAANHDVGQQTAANHRAGQQQQQRQQQTAAAAVGSRLSEHRATSVPDHHRGNSHRTRRPQRAPATQTPGPGPRVPPQSLSPLDPSIPDVDPKVFSRRRFRSSPRVVFSAVPPTHAVPEGKDPAGGGEGGRGGARVRRQAGTPLMHRGEYSVCDSVSHWVENRTTATDIRGREVTVLPNVRIENLVKRQFFYETTCLSPSQGGPGGPRGGAGANRGRGAGGGRGRKQGSRGGATSGCRGIDVRYWNSYCTNTHTYVSAMTTFEEKPAWRNIRINVACGCVITRKSWQGRAGR